MNASDALFARECQSPFIDRPAPLSRVRRNAQVPNLHGAAFGDHEVCRLDVSMDDAFELRVLKAPCSFKGDFYCALHRQDTLTGEEILDAAASHVFHGIKEDPVQDIDIVDSNNIGMRELACLSGLADEKRAKVAVASQVIGEHFERHYPVEA